VIRGSGLAGLAAIPDQRPLSNSVALVRPMLSLWRRDVETYLEALGQDFRLDASNEDDRYTRNRVRHELLPLLLRGLLHFVCFALFFGDLPIGLRLHELRRGIDIANECINRLHIIRANSCSNVLSGIDLALSTGTQEVEHRVILRRIAEIISDDRLQDVVHEVLHRTDARNHLRRVQRPNMNDLRDVEIKRKTIFERTVMDESLS
jgi:tRNA(Ile)-lysidine synthase TilS/MesJ